MYIYFTCESKNNKIDSMWAIFYQWPKLPINFIFGTFLHCNMALGFCHIHTFHVH